VLKPQLFDYLEERTPNNVRERGECQLTSALDRLRQEDGFQGLIVDGRRFDIGLPERYLDTLAAFSRNEGTEDAVIRRRGRHLAGTTWNR
jgi:UTP-glucose-1-phosphate uridylyltransferase